MISVIVCTYNRAHYLQDTLAHLLKQEMSINEFEVLVIDNNSSDETENICTVISKENPHFPFQFVKEYVQGLSHARNRGVKEANGNILTFIDDDAFAKPDFVKNIAQHFTAHKDTMAIGGRIIPQYESGPPAWMSKHLLPPSCSTGHGR